MLLALAFGSLFSFELLGAAWLHKRGLWPLEDSSYDFYLLVLKTRFALLVNAAVAIFGAYLVLEMRIESKALILADIIAAGVLPVVWLVACGIFIVLLCRRYTAM